MKVIVLSPPFKFVGQNVHKTATERPTDNQRIRYEGRIRKSELLRRNDNNIEEKFQTNKKRHTNICRSTIFWIYKKDYFVTGAATGVVAGTTGIVLSIVIFTRPLVVV